MADANAEWGANCGPGAIAAICGLRLFELRPHMGDFEQKGYTNPTLMWKVLRSLHVDYHVVKAAAWPDYGLARIQWEGPWTAPGVPPRVAYRHTHWIGTTVRQSDGQRGIFDINAMHDDTDKLKINTGWSSLFNWQNLVVPFILEHHVSGASGKWHLTHGIEIRMTS